MARCFYCLGEHETSQCVSRATDRIISGQKTTAKATADIIEELGHRTLEQLSEVRYDLLGGLEGIQGAIEELHSFLSWAHSEITWRMEKQIELLTGIHNMLKNPRATQADELYKMGVDSFKRHRLPDALKLLQEAHELNPGDYRVLVTFGHTHAQMDDLHRALECFQAATDYARANNYKGEALLLTTRTYRCLGQLNEATETAKQAIEVIEQFGKEKYVIVEEAYDKAWRENLDEAFDKILDEVKKGKPFIEVMKQFFYERILQKEAYDKAVRENLDEAEGKPFIEVVKRFIDEAEKEASDDSAKRDWLEIIKQVSNTLPSYFSAHYELASCIGERLKGSSEREAEQLLLASLSIAIKGNRHFFVAAETDLNFDPVRVHVDGLLAELTQEAKIQAEKKIAFAQMVLNEMKEWHTHEAAPSEYNSALNTMAKARKNFQTNSYFGYLDAQLLAGEAKKKAKSAIDAQKAHMKGVIDKLKSQAAQLWGDQGDFDKYEVKRYAPTEAVRQYEKQARNCCETETYDSYSQAQSLLRECLRLGYTAIEKAMEAPKKHEFALLGTALAFLLSSALLALWFWILTLAYMRASSVPPLAYWAFFLLGYLSPVPIGISYRIWDWDKKEPGTNFNSAWLGGILFGPLVGFASIYWIFQYSQNRRAIEDRYRRRLEQLREKYTPVC